MKKSILLITLSIPLLLLQDCKSKGKNFTETSDTLKFFPVNLYIKGQIAKVDSLASTIYKITINNNSGVKDTITINKQQFNNLAQDFLAYDISDKHIHKYYKENVFADETTQSLTFNYTAMDSSLPLQSVDVLLDQTGQQLKNVFFSKTITQGDSTVTEKCGWTNDKSFFINRVTEYADNTTTTQQNIIVWMFQP
ncbi:MAG TPA: hypothetical protein VG738_15650 [Chitinophagaceae bacterium]|nr:hypothetical protein [Chitinophagaceae bacterium]